MSKRPKQQRYKPERPVRRRVGAQKPVKVETPPKRSRAVYLFGLTGALWALFLSGIGERFGPPGTLPSILLGAAVVTLVMAVMTLFRERAA